MKPNRSLLLPPVLSATLLCAVALPTLSFLSAPPAHAQRYRDDERSQVSAPSQDYINITEARLQALEEQVQRLTNSVEQANYQAQQAQTRLQRLEEDLNVRFRMIEDRMSTEASPSSAEAVRSDAPSGNDGAISATKPASSGSTSSGSTGAEEVLGQTRTPAQSSTAGGYPDDPNAAYDLAFTKVRDGDYEAAEAGMREFVSRWPKSELASNASYWLAETFYVRGQYEKAARSFAESYQNYPKGAKAEDTLVKLGVTLSVLNRTKDACITFAQAEKEFPDLKPSNRRRIEQERKTLDCQ